MYLLDTHALIWSATDPSKLSRRVYKLLLNTEEDVWVSAASVWEMATKQRTGKLVDVSALLTGFEEQMEDAGFRMLSISCRHALVAGLFEVAHKDPWDRMLAAQAISEGLKLVSKDRAFDPFAVERFW